MRSRIGILAWGSLSPLGDQPEDIWSKYLDHKTALSKTEAFEAWVGRLSVQAESSIDALQALGKPYTKLDRTVLLAQIAAEKAMMSFERDKQGRWGINMGSSRGATEKFEAYHDNFLRGKRLSPNASPLTTLGNVATWVGQHLGVDAMALSHSVTCSTALQSILNAVAWLEAGRCDFFLAGGTEAPLSNFTLAQMRALRIYSQAEKEAFPCRSLDLKKTVNTMVLGEGAACFILGADEQEALAWIVGMGYAIETISSPASISEDGQSLQKSMQMALAEAELSTVDVVVCHTPGTIQGDLAEWQAVQNTFKGQVPYLTSNKWKIGHTLGASGGLSLEMALLMLQHQTCIGIPFGESQTQNKPTEIKTIMVNAAGFGGNAVSIILSKT